MPKNIKPIIKSLNTQTKVPFSPTNEQNIARNCPNYKSPEKKTAKKNTVGMFAEKGKPTKLRSNLNSTYNLGIR